MTGLRKAQDIASELTPLYYHVGQEIRFNEGEQR